MGGLKIKIFLWRFAVFALAVSMAVGIAFKVQKPEPIYIERLIPTPKIETVYIERDDGCSPYYKDIASTITQEEIDLIAGITLLEAGNQSMTGKRAVVEVIFNRILSDEFPNTVHDVIFQKNQFTTAKNLSVAKPTQEEYEAIEMVLNESEPILDVDVMFFSPNGFRNRTTYDRIGGHVFCY